MEQKISTYKINKVAKGIILSLEEFMDNCSVSLAKSMVKFWLCTGPNPLFVKSKNTYINYPKKLKAPYEDISKRLRVGVDYKIECAVMYKIYSHFYSNYDTGGCIFGGGFLLDLFKAKAAGKQVKNKKVEMSW